MHRLLFLLPLFYFSLVFALDVDYHQLNLKVDSINKISLLDEQLSADVHLDQNKHIKNGQCCFEFNDCSSLGIISNDGIPKKLSAQISQSSNSSEDSHLYVKFNTNKKLGSRWVQLHLGHDKIILRHILPNCNEQSIPISYKFETDLQSLKKKYIYTIKYTLSDK